MPIYPIFVDHYYPPIIASASLTGVTNPTEIFNRPDNFCLPVFACQDSNACFHIRMEALKSNHSADCSSRTNIARQSIDCERRLIRLAQSGCQSSRNQLLLDNRRSIQQLVGTHCRFSQDLSDLEHESILALAESIDRYDLNHPARVRLMTFARKHILGALSAFYRSSVNLPVSLEEPGPIVDEDALPLDHQVDVEHLRSILEPVIEGLDERSQAILRRRVMADEPTRLRVLADDYQISCARVHALERKALSRLQDQILSHSPDLMPISVHC
jgi:RNA polymerase sigma factor (sigma-70 family)